MRRQYNCDRATGEALYDHRKLIQSKQFAMGKKQRYEDGRLVAGPTDEEIDAMAAREWERVLSRR